MLSPRFSNLVVKKKVTTVKVYVFEGKGEYA